MKSATCDICVILWLGLGHGWLAQGPEVAASSK